MNKGRFIGGTILLALGALLVVLTFALEEGKVVFMIGDENMPLVPAIVMIVIGAVLLGSALMSPGKKVDTAVSELGFEHDEKAVALNRQLEGAAWGFFLIMLGGFALVPATTIPKGVWSIGVGVIMLGLNLARYFFKLRLSGFTTFLGVMSLLGGIAQLAGWQALDNALFFFVLGAYLILKPWFDKHQVFGKIA